VEEPEEQGLPTTSEKPDSENYSSKSD